jgi:uncharacterized repeat protein (TIGR01451 family)
MNNRRTSLCLRICSAILICLSAGIVSFTSFKHSAAKEGSGNTKAITAVAREVRPDLTNLAAKLPLTFEPNVGQTSKTVRFISRGSGYSLFLTASEAIFLLQKSQVMRFRLLGSNKHSRASGLTELPGRQNYLLGNDPKKWHTNIPTYQQVGFEDVYPGINLRYYGNQRQLEYDFEVAPGADPRSIRFGFDAGAKPHITKAGELVLNSDTGEIRQQKPNVYQEIAGQRHTVECRYVLLGTNQVGFATGSYDPRKPLVIDPTLIYSTYLGGAGDDAGSSVAVDSSNNVYVAGTTGSTNFPMKNAAFGTNAGLADIFVTKIDASGTNIIYSTYVGGSGLDRGNSLAVDSSGNAYVVGRVDSSSTNFPTTPGVFAPSYRGGDFDAVIFKLNSQGSAFVYSTFLGGEENDSTEGVALDPAGNLYVTGGTKSIGFPTTIGAFQASRAGDTDAYISKMNPSGSALLYSSFLGGSGTDRGSGVAIDSGGNAYVSGFTASPDFPTENAFQNSYGGSFDAFVAKINTNANGADSLVLCSYLGGTADDKAFGIAIDAGNNIYVVGQTSSNDLPLLNPAQPAFGGAFDAFVAKISNAGVKVFTTYLGGAGDDRGTGIAVNSAGAAYVTGFTSSTNFPTVIPIQNTKGGGSDAFVAKLSDSGSTLIYSTYFGGSGNENSVGTVTSTNPIALDSLSNAYFTGYTTSNNLITASALQPTNGGGPSDAFLAKISDFTPAADFDVTVTPNTRFVNPGNNTTYNLVITPISAFTGNVTLGISGLPANVGAAFNPSSLTITDANPVLTLLTVTTAASTPSGSHQLNLTASGGNLQHNTSVSLVVAGATSANLSLTKSASPNPAIVSGNLTYRINVANTGPSPATNAIVTDPLPSGVIFVSATPTQGTCSGTSTVNCNLGTIPSGSSSVVNIVVIPQLVGQLGNTASVSATESDPDSADNLMTITTTVGTQLSGPTMLDPNLTVSTLVTGLDQPTSLAFLAANDFLVLEKASGKVQRIVNGTLHSTALDLPVNSASERGLLGIALHPQFPSNRFVYLYWTESTSGTDSTDINAVALLGQRVDRYIWNGATLTFDRNLIRLRALQQDAGQTARGNHNGGVLRFGQDGKLYILMGDNGRRGLLQNITSGGPVPDDQFGGPEPDDAHLTGVILRLNDDGTTPVDNPFFNVNSGLAGEAAANVKKVYAYGVRNGFGMAVDPMSGSLWTQENGDDAFDEMNRVQAGFNGGWVQVIGPVSRIAEFKSIESTYAAGNLQQLRWPPSNIADTPQAALARIYMLPGAQYVDPEFSWKYAVAPAAIGFVKGRGLGPQFEGDMFIGASRTTLLNGYLFRLKLSGDRQHFSFTDPNLADRVADNSDKFDIAESESLVVGRDFGIATDIQTGPNGNVFVVSLSNGAVYQIAANPFRQFRATLTSAQEVPANNSTATGTATILLDSTDGTQAKLSLNFAGLSTAEISAHIHGPAPPGTTASVAVGLPLGQLNDFQIALTAAQVQQLKAGLLYINVHSTNFPNGEIRGQFLAQPATEIRTWTTLGRTYALVKLTFPDGTFRITNSGQVTRSGNDFSVDAAIERSTAASLPVLSDDAQIYDLGPLTTGSYTFTLKVSGAVVRTQDFTVSSIPALPNPIDDQRQFVRQQYLDFLNREPDQAGWDFWTDNITKCGDPARRPPGQTEAQCIDRQRETTSAAFFLSPEFQYTGYFVYRFYKGALGRPPKFSEFIPDSQFVAAGIIVNNQLSAARIEANKSAFANLFVGKPEFLAIYGALTNPQYVDKLFQTTTINASAADRAALVMSLDNGTETRATVLKKIVDGTVVISEGNQQFTTTYGQAFYNLEFNPAFVQMEYFGYLRRDPDAAGYAFWLAKLNLYGNYLDAEMVKAFITSPEYRSRFGQP